MAKIALFDCCRFKFSKVLIDHWEKQGHEVRKTLYWDPKMVEWSDVVFFDWTDNSMIRFSNPNDELYTANGLTIPRNKRIITRCHDIDAWCGHYARVDWSLVDDLIFVGKHIQDLVLGNQPMPSNVNVHLFKHGIELERFPFRNKAKGNKIAWVGRIVGHKCIELALQVLAENPTYELHCLGSSLDSWELYYVNDFCKRNNLKFFHTPESPNVDEFLQDKDYILLTSFKEAFSYAIGEGMAKGLKPLIHHFYGAENVWPQKYIWEKVSDVKPMLEGDYNPQEYHDFIANNYPMDNFFKQYDDLIKPKG